MGLRVSAPTTWVVTAPWRSSYRSSVSWSGPSGKALGTNVSMTSGVLVLLVLSGMGPRVRRGSIRGLCWKRGDIPSDKSVRLEAAEVVGWRGPCGYTKGVNEVEGMGALGVRVGNPYGLPYIPCDVNGACRGVWAWCCWGICGVWDILLMNECNMLARCCTVVC